METPMNNTQGHTHLEEPCAPTPMDEISSDEECDLNEWVHAIEEMRAPVPSVVDSSDQYNHQVEELEKKVAYLKSHVNCMEKVISRQQLEIETLKLDWNKKQCKIEQLKETIRSINVVPNQQIENEACDLHQVSTKTSELSHPSEEEKVERLRRSRRKRKLGADFSLIYYALDQLQEMKLVESVSEQGPAKDCMTKKSRKSPENSTSKAVSHARDQGETSQSSESVKQEVTLPLKISVIPSEKSTVSTDDVQPHTIEATQANAKISAFPNGWFLIVPSSPNKPPTPRKGCCLSCYEHRNVRFDRRHCKECWSKMRKLKNAYPNVAVPQCTHQLNQPMRGCDGCMVRVFILRYNLANPHVSYVIPYSTVDLVGTSKSTLPPNDLDLSSYKVENIAQDEKPCTSSFPVEHTRPQLGVFETVDSSIHKNRQQVFSGQASDQIQNTTPDVSEGMQNTALDLSLPSLLRDNEWAKPGKTSVRIALATSPTLATILNNPNLSIQCEKVQKSPQGAAFSLSSSSKHTSTKKKKKFSAFPKDWFLAIPDYANKPPTPRIGYCYSCYERKSRLIKQHCQACWYKAKSLKHAYLKDANTPIVRCNHPLNLPMRGCEACILRAFIVRYNLQFPERSFLVPYNKVDSGDPLIVEKVPEHFPNPYTGFGFLLDSDPTVERVSEQHAGMEGESSGIPDFATLMFPSPRGLLQSNQKCGLSSNFPEKLFSVVPHDLNVLPTPRLNHCISCYEAKITLDIYCLICRRVAKIMEDSYIENPNISLPGCIHQLNLPMSGCVSCILRAYILTYNKRNPDKPYAIPYEKINSECELLRDRQNVSCKTELSIVATRSLQPKPTTGMFFPHGWFQNVPDDVYDLPTPRNGCCQSCYEYKTRAPHCNKKGLSLRGFCGECIEKAERLAHDYKVGLKCSIPQCTHELNRPMRGCEVCIIRAFIVCYNRRNPIQPFPVPYELVGFEISLERIQQLVPQRNAFDCSAQTLPLEQSKNFQNEIIDESTVSIDSEDLADEIRVKQEAVEDGHSINAH